MQNVLTVDVEDWESAISGVFGDFKPSTERVYKNTIELLEILEKYNSKATFFFLGEVAEKFPSLLKEVLNSGHSIACHGYTHREIHKLPFDKLKEELKKAKDTIEKIIGKEIIGFRAPNFSLMKASPEVLDLLVELGFKYDSSIFPYKKYQNEKMDLKPFWLETKNKNKIFEVPLSVISFFGLRIPCSGGAFFRNYPLFFTKLCLSKISKEKRPVNFYIHPHEFEDINFKNIGLKINFIRKFLEKNGRRRAGNYLLNILKNYKFNSIENIYFS